MLRGEDTEKIRDRGHSRLSTYGLLKGSTKHELREWIYQLIAQDFLRQTEDEYPILRLGARARDAMRGAVEVKLRQPAVRKKDAGAPRSSSHAPLDPLQPHDRELFERLRIWRRAEARAARRAAVRHLQRQDAARAGARAADDAARAARHLRHRRREARGVRQTRS